MYTGCLKKSDPLENTQTSLHTSGSLECIVISYKDIQGLELLFSNSRTFQFCTSACIHVSDRRFSRKCGIVTTESTYTYVIYKTNIHPTCFTKNSMLLYMIILKTVYIAGSSQYIGVHNTELRVGCKPSCQIV